MSKRIKKLLLGCCLFFSCLQSGLLSANAGTVLKIDETFKWANLDSAITILVDKEHQLTIEEVSKEGQRPGFKPVSEIGNSFGFSKHVYWVRFSLDFDQSFNEPLYLQFEYPLIDRLTLFIPNQEGSFSQVETGDHFVFDQRELEFRNFLFKLPDSPGEPQEYFLRVQSEGSVQVPLSLWRASELIEKIDVDNLFLGIYYGIMLLLVAGGLASYARIHDRLFLVYALYLLSYILFQFSLNGLSYQYLWPDSPWFTSRATSAFVGGVVICGLFFSGSFLQIWGDKHPKTKRFFYGLMLLGAIGLVLSLFGDYAFAVKISTAAGVSLPPVVLFGALVSLSSGYRPARYFLAAWGVFLMGVFVAGLLYLGFVPHTFLTLNSMQIGSVLEVFLLAFALMDRISLLRKEKEEATLKAHHYLNQINEGLEKLVEERTRQLKEKNHQLEELACRDSLTGLLNHRVALEQYELMRKTAYRYRSGLSVLMLDIDDFKQINDRFGHPVGDLVINRVAGVLRDCSRETDCCGRYGGEEFVLVLNQIDRSFSLEVGERILGAIRCLRITELRNENLTASIGISLFDPERQEQDLIELADKALYRAKAEGKNRISVN